MCALNTNLFVLQSMLDKYSTAVSVLKSLEEKSIQRLKEEKRESLALLPSQSSEKPKTEADLLQDKQHLSLQLHQTQNHLEVRFRVFRRLFVHYKAIRFVVHQIITLIHGSLALQFPFTGTKTQTSFSMTMPLCTKRGL